jgi:hypothetical protein
MKKAIIILAVLCGIRLMTACNSGAQHLAAIDFSNVQEYIAADDENFKVDSINGYSTFSADNRIVIVPEEITKKEYERLLTDKYTLHPVAIDTNSALYAELDSLSRPNARHIYLMRGYTPYDEMLQEIRGESEIKADSIFYFPETKQYEFMMWVPLTTVSFMMTEDGIVDTTFMQSETRTYGTNRIFVGQEGHDCDFTGSLWFYRYDEQNHHMVPLCHYLDYRWNEECYGFSLCWISDNELLVSACSNGNSQWGYAGGYKPTTLAPHGTPVYYKLTITLQ